MLKIEEQYWVPRSNAEIWKSFIPNIRCIEGDEMFIHSEKNNPLNFSSIKIELEHCSTNSEITCATDEERVSYWGNTGV